MYNHLLYIFFWATNTLILIIASTVAPEHLTLGNARFNNVESGIYAGFWITFIIWAFWDFSMGRRYNLSRKYRSFIFFFLVNFFAFWGVSNFENWVGFSQQDLNWVIIVAIVATLLQRVIKKSTTKRSVNSAWF